MRKFQILIFALVTAGLLNGCTFIGNMFRYKATTKEFADALLKKDYDKCIGFMATDNEIAKHTNIDTLKMGLDNFRNLIVNHFGDTLEYTFMTSEKIRSTTEGESTPPNTTRVLMQFNNDKEFGVFQVLFDDTSKKVLNIKALELKEAIPNMNLFWLFGLLAICIPLFNIFMIILVKRSQLKKKWLKYLAIVMLNVPAITYNAVSGLSFGLLSFQFLLGISFEYMGYLNSAFTFGFPLGGLYILGQIQNIKNDPFELPINEITTTGEQSGSEAN